MSAKYLAHRLRQMTLDIRACESRVQMLVLETLLRYGYFWTKVRVQGGAYGAFTSFNRCGDLFFGSYRDPNLQETLAVFDHTGDFVRLSLM